MCFPSLTEIMQIFLGKKWVEKLKVKNKVFFSLGICYNHSEIFDEGKERRFIQTQKEGFFFPP